MMIIVTTTITTTTDVIFKLSRINSLKAPEMKMNIKLRPFMAVFVEALRDHSSWEMLFKIETLALTGPVKS